MQPTQYAAAKFCANVAAVVDPAMGTLQPAMQAAAAAYGYTVRTRRPAAAQAQAAAQLPAWVAAAVQAYFA